MLTRCPTCHTRFRVHLEHLYAASGQVRCGRCSHVFDARHQSIALEPPSLLSPDALTHLKPKNKHNKNNTILWNLGSLLLCVILFMQWLWWERYWLIQQPYIDLLVVTMCQHLPCNMPEFRDLQRIRILERSLDTSIQGIAVFKLLMINQAAQAQSYPVLELKLIDDETNVVGARRFTPQQYGLNKIPDALIMLPGQAITVTLEMVNPENKAIGFQIEFW